MSDAIMTASGKSRKNIKSCIDKVLVELRQRIMGEITLEEKRKSTNPTPKGGAFAKAAGRKDGENKFEALQFPAGMTYAHRSSLRKECTRFLRFAYLVDFLSLESLTHIYINSLEQMIDRLNDLNSDVDMDTIMKMQFDE
jgi:dynein heavy chain